MGKSARLLGSEFGLTAREMNTLLKDYGYLTGEPGAYELTEKGSKYGEVQHNDNGYGGYAYRGWETRTWNEGTAAALKADIEANPEGLEAQEPAAYEPEADMYAPDPTADSPGLSGRELAVAGAIVGAVVAAVVAAPHVRTFWNNKVKPAAHKVRAKFTTQESVEPG